MTATPTPPAGAPLRRELRGDLKDVSLATILTTVKERKLTGELSFTRGSDAVGLQLNNGEILFAHSNDPATRLGEWLLMRGKISVAQYEESVRILKETGKRQGTILLELGIIPPIELERSVRQQVCDIVFGLFNWTSGGYHFVPQDRSGEMITLDISLTELILRGIGQIRNFPVIEKGLKPFTDVYEINKGFDLHEARRVRLSQEEDSILHLVDGQSSIEKLIERSPFPAYVTLRGLYAYKAARVIRKRPF
jgi:hypothetical protein